MPTGHVFIATSLDGFIAREDGGIDWLLSRDAADEDHGYDAFIAEIDAIVMGRGSFAMVATFDAWPYTRPVHVLSASLTEDDVPAALRGKVHLARDTAEGLFDRLGRDGVGRVYVDGGTVIQSFLRAGLIEDLIITQVPVLLGSGRPLFGPVGGDVALTHRSTRAFPSGLVQSHYAVAAAGAAGGRRAP
jgi:dihydrofolate reductase